MSRPVHPVELLVELPVVAPWSISLCHQLSAFACSTIWGLISLSPARLPVLTSLQTNASYFAALAWNPYGPPTTCAWPWSALAMKATRSPDFAAASAIAAPASMCAEAGRSRAGVTTTSGTGGSCRPPMNHSGISTPQSIGATAVAGSLPPKLTPTDGTPAEASDSSTSQARSVAAGTSRAIEGGAPTRRPATRPATSTPIAFPLWTLWGVATTTASGRSAAKSLPSSSIPAWVDFASKRSSGEHASTIARPPWGAIAANTRPPRSALVTSPLGGEGGARSAPGGGGGKAAGGAAG